MEKFDRNVRPKFNEQKLGRYYNKLQYVLIKYIVYFIKTSHNVCNKFININL